MEAQARVTLHMALMFFASLLAQLGGVLETSECIAQESKPKGDPPSKVDFLSDPLPAGALARLGTARLRGQVLTFVDDGKTLVTFAADRALHYWDVASGKERMSKQLPFTPIDKFGGIIYQTRARSANGKWFVTADPETIHVWEVATGKEVDRYANPTFQQRTTLTRLAISNDGKLVAEAVLDVRGKKNPVQMRNLTTGKELQFLFEEGDYAHVALSPDNKALIVAGQKGAIRAYATTDGKELWQVNTGPLSDKKIFVNLQAPAISPDGKTLAWLDGPTTAKLYHMADGKEKTAVPLPGSGRQFNCEFSQDGAYLAIANESGALIWDLAKGKELRKLPATMITFDRFHRGEVAFSPDGKTLAVSGRLCDLTTGKMLHESTGHHGDVRTIVFADDGKAVASATNEDPVIRLWNPITGRQLAAFDCPEHTGAITFTPDGKHLLTGERKGSIKVWSMETGKVLRHFNVDAEKSDKFYYAVTNLASDGKTVTAYGVRNDQTNEKVFKAINWHMVLDFELKKTHNRQDLEHDFFAYVAPGAIPYNRIDQRTALRNALTGKTVVRFDAPFSGYSFPRDGKAIALSFGDAANLVDLATGRELAKFKTDKNSDLEISPDRRILATANRTEVTIWEIATGKRVHRIPAPALFSASHDSAFCSRIRFSPNSRTLALGFIDSTILLYDIAPELVPTPGGKPPGPKELDQLWADLGSEDAAKAYRAIWTLAGSPEQAVPFLKGHLKPASVNSKQIGELLAELGSATFATRDAAFKKLQTYDIEIEPALRRAIAAGATIEFRRRAEQLLEMPPGMVRDREVLRGVRAIWMLEASGTSEARQVLQALAKGADDARLTQEAKVSLERLK